MASQEIERLQAELAAVKAALAVEKKEKKKILKAGGDLSALVYEMYVADLCPESWAGNIDRLLKRWNKNSQK